MLKQSCDIATLGQTWKRETILYLEDHVRSLEDIEEQHHHQHVEFRNHKPYKHIQTDIIQQKFRSPALH